MLSKQLAELQKEPLFKDKATPKVVSVENLTTTPSTTPPSGNTTGNTTEQECDCSLFEKPTNGTNTNGSNDTNGSNGSFLQRKAMEEEEEDDEEEESTGNSTKTCKFWDGFRVIEFMFGVTHSRLRDFRNSVFV